MDYTNTHPGANTIDLTVTVTVTANADETFDLACSDHDFDRRGITLKQLQGVIATVFMEAGNRLSYKVVQQG